MDWLTVSGFTGAAAAAAATGMLFRPGLWYQSLAKPGWSPPNVAFPIAWTVLYIAMVVAAVRVAGTPDPAPALALWAFQITLNALWTPVFFGLHRKGAAVFVIAALWLAIAVTTVLFWQRDVFAGLLFTLYLGWVSFAAALNFDIWRRNRHPSGHRS
ncbi:tryptophan-rich sensory protein TspO [Algicella marina]|uniref:Sensory protein TspO n=1 Tax=Algicella marina TaxID=2683284 RepID=A0A6P1T369_9RHOB|nr:TspO/MBR family protein [Algicella marina]QHQ36457.1 sensory protein TspO [Algicella marina]